MVNIPVVVPPPATDRAALRRRLLADRERYAAAPGAAAAGTALGAHLRALLRSLEPGVLGVYWPVRSEFNAVAALAADAAFAALPLALPFAHRAPPALDYRRWDGRPPTALDGCGIPTGDGAVAVPDVVLVPCVGHTADGYRLGYGGGYFDRWLAAHPAATTVGIGWSIGSISRVEFAPQPHDRPLTLVVTERGVEPGG